MIFLYKTVLRIYKNTSRPKLNKNKYHSGFLKYYFPMARMMKQSVQLTKYKLKMHRLR